MSNEKLLPCPFCLGEAELQDNEYIGFLQAIECCSCGAKSKDFTKGDDSLLQEAITKWNTRHEPKREFVVNQTKGGE